MMVNLGRTRRRDGGGLTRRRDDATEKMGGQRRARRAQRKDRLLRGWVSRVSGWSDQVPGTLVIENRV